MARDDIITYTEARNNLKSVMDKVWEDSAPVIITRAGGKPVVMISKDDYDSMAETEYLMRSPANAAELRRALKEAKKGKNLVPVKFDKNGHLVRAD
ncbi:MAG: type II toxin-antitoxin system prevent-host-death family antitoxin [Alphaproteobacteria bacterium]